MQLYRPRRRHLYNLTGGQKSYTDSQLYMSFFLLHVLVVFEILDYLNMDLCFSILHYGIYFVSCYYTSVTKTASLSLLCFLDCTSFTHNDASLIHQVI